MKCGMKSCGSYSPFSPTATARENLAASEARAREAKAAEEKAAEEKARGRRRK